MLLDTEWPSWKNYKTKTDTSRSDSHDNRTQTRLRNPRAQRQGAWNKLRCSEESHDSLWLCAQTQAKAGFTDSRSTCSKWESRRCSVCCKCSICSPWYKVSCPPSNHDDTKMAFHKLFRECSETWCEATSVDRWGEIKAEHPTLLLCKQKMHPSNAKAVQ